MFTGVVLAKPPALSFSLDHEGRVWSKSYEVHNEEKGFGTVEFTTNGENADGWTEMFSLQYLNGVKSSPHLVWQNFLESLNRRLTPSRATWKILEMNDDSMLVEWSVNDKTPKSQYELVKILANGTNVLALRYTTKKLHEVYMIKPKWIEILNTATFE